MSYFDGFVIAVPEAKKQAYIEMAQIAAPIFKKHGAIRTVETWGNDIPKGKTNDFRTAVLAEESENVVFSFIEWPSKEVRDTGMKAAMEDPAMQPDPANMPFDGKRMIFGGFDLILDHQ